MKSFAAFLLILFLSSIHCNNNTTNATTEELKESLSKIEDELTELKEALGQNQSFPEDNMTEEEYEKQFNEDIQAILKEMKLDDKETMTKKQFETLFKKVMTKDDPDEDTEESEQILAGITEKLMVTIPDTVYVKNITQYFNSQKLAEIFSDLLGDLGADFDLLGMNEQVDENVQDEMFQDIEKKNEEEKIEDL